MKKVALLIAMAACAGTAFAQPLTFVTNEPGAGFIDISGNLLDSLVLTDDGVVTITMGAGEGNALFPPGGTWTIGNNGAMGFNIPLSEQSLPPGPGAFPIPGGAGQLGPAFGGIEKALIPGWDDEGDSANPVQDVFAKVDTVNNMLIVQWNDLPVGVLGDTTTFQVQVPFGTLRHVAQLRGVCAVHLHERREPDGSPRRALLDRLSGWRTRPEQQREHRIHAGQRDRQRNSALAHVSGPVLLADDRMPRRL